MDHGHVTRRTPSCRLLFLLAGALLLAFGLRVCQLPAQSLWYDEGVSWHMTQKTLPDLTAWTARDIQPPFYYYLLWSWVRLAGTSEYALRFPSVAFGLLTVSLVWALTRRLWGTRAAGLAVVLVTISPLHVYYAQEARMYTLLTWLGLLSSYLLVRLTGTGQPPVVHPARVVARRRRLMGTLYVLSSAAALYTHYFALFLLAAHGMYLAYRWLRLGCPPIACSAARAVAGIGAAIGLLYAPWLPYQLARYGEDASYWPGQLKLDEVISKLFIAFGLGETVKETLGHQLAVGYGALSLLSLAVLIYAAARRAGHKRPFHDAVDGLVFSLLYLILPVALILALAMQVPKFNPRYAMLASPAFLLLLAAGLSLRFPRRLGQMLNVVQVAAIAFVFVTSAMSLANWYAPYRTNQFNKADFRITAQLVRERIQPHETVLLSSGHMFPAWAYYYGWSGWHRLPDIEIVDVHAMLDMGVGERLGELLRQQRGVWLVRWQNQVTDPFDVLPLYLGTFGVQDDYGQFWQMELRHYRLTPGNHYSVEAFITQPAEVTFGDQIELLGMRQLDHDRLALIWRTLAAPTTDYTVFVHLLDAQGKTLANADHLPALSTSLWRPGHILPDQVHLTAPPGLLAGQYQLEVGLYNAQAPGMPRLAARGVAAAGDRALLTFTVGHDAAGTAEAEPPRR